MIKALAIKELRESLGITAVAALAMAWLVLACMGRNALYVLMYRSYDTNHIAFVGDGFFDWTAIFAGALAVMLGFKQSAWEVHHNTISFLFHRPLSRRLVLAIKLMVGALLVFSVLAVSIVIYGIWAATPGHLPAPFEWSMTLDSWKLACTLPLIYLGAFLSGIRPGRWFGTRLLPLVATILWSAILSISPYWWLQVPLLVVGYVGLLSSIDYYTETRDY
jgi:hypothetical protein